MNSIPSSILDAGDRMNVLTVGQVFVGFVPFGYLKKSVVRGLVFPVAVAIANASIAAPFLEGTVKDEHGRPLEGATVQILDCVGTCFGGDTRITDSAGHYVFEQPSFRNSPHLTVSMPGRYHASTDISGPPLHAKDNEAPRRANFVLGTPAAANIRIEGVIPENMTQTVKLRASRDAKLHRYDLDGRHVSGWNVWNFDQIPRSEAYHLVIVWQPKVEPADDEKVTRERERESRRKQVEIVSQPIRFLDPQRYSIRAMINADENSGDSYLNLSSIKDALDQERIADLATPDAAFGPPVSKELHHQATELLKRIEKTARPWNDGIPESVVSYQYRAIDASGKTTPVAIDKNSPKGPSWSDISRLRGFAYMPPLRWLFTQPDNVVFYDVDSNADETKLVYRLKEPRGFSAGLGVGPGWNGFFSRSFSAGTLTIDTKNATVLEHRLSAGPLGEESVETFSDYIPVGDGYAPLSMRIRSSQDFRLRFKVHQNHLWLLDQASHGDNAAPTLRIDQVKVLIANRN